jgi:hypothetical protein
LSHAGRVNVALSFYYKLDGIYAGSITYFHLRSSFFAGSQAKHPLARLLIEKYTQLHHYQSNREKNIYLF